MWEPQAPTHFYTDTLTHILCIIIEFLMKIKVYHNITDWMILIRFYYRLDWLRGAYVYLPSDSLSHGYGWEHARAQPTKVTLGRAKIIKYDLY